MGLDTTKQELEKQGEKALTQDVSALTKVITGKHEILEAILDSIDSVSINPVTNLVHIRTSKNIAIENDGHMIVVNSGMQVLLSKQIHLNPKINFSTDNIDVIENDLDEARKKEVNNISQKKLENNDCFS